MIYTTNALERVHARVRKIIETRGHFPTVEAATKLIWLALRNITAGWSHPAHHWLATLNQFAILYEDRFLKAFLFLQKVSPFGNYPGYAVGLQHA